MSTGDGHREEEHPSNNEATGSVVSSHGGLYYDMSPSPRKHPKNEDINEAAFRVVREATEKHDPENRQKNPAAVALGKLGASKGGKARAQKLSAARRKAIAKRAAAARWRKSP